MSRRSRRIGALSVPPSSSHRASFIHHSTGGSRSRFTHPRPSEQRAVALLGAPASWGPEFELGAYFRCDLAPVLGGLVQSGDVQAVLSCVP